MKVALAIGCAASVITLQASFVGCESDEALGGGATTAPPDASLGGAHPGGGGWGGAPTGGQGAAGNDGGAAGHGGAAPLSFVSVPAPRRFGGANAFRIFTQVDIDPVNGTAVNAAAQIQAMRTAGLRVLRIFLHQEDSVPWEMPPATYTFEDPIGVYHDDKLEWIDRLMPLLLGDPDDPFDDIQLVVTMFNHIKGTAAGDVKEDLYFAQFGERGFYADPNARVAFKNRIAHVLNHPNPYLGNLPWKDLPIIAAWEPANEPGVHTKGTANPTDAELLADWLGDMASTIKSIDNDGTLVAAGTAAGSTYYNFDIGDSIPALLSAAGGAIPGIDVYTIHMYYLDVNQVVADARDVLPAGAQLWIEEFGATRSSGEPLAYDLGALGVLGRIQAAHLPWLFWEMGPRADASCFDRFQWDGDWSHATELALPLQRKLTDFDGGMGVEVRRGNGSAVAVALVAGPRGQALQRVMQAGYEDLSLKLLESHDARGSAVTLRARTTEPVSTEIQVKDSLGRYTTSNPIIALGPDWTYFQLPLDGFSSTNNFDAGDLREIVLWFKAGSGAGVELDLDDVWLW